MDPRIKIVGNRIKQIRKEKNLSQADLAEKMNVSTSYVSDVENGKINFSIDTFMRLTEALQISADWLLQTNIPSVKELHTSEIANSFSVGFTRISIYCESSFLTHFVLNVINLLEKVMLILFNISKN